MRSKNSLKSVGVLYSHELRSSLLRAWRGIATDCLEKFWMPHARGAQGWVGWGPGQTDLLGGSTARGRGLELGSL